MSPRKTTAQVVDEVIASKTPASTASRTPTAKPSPIASALNLAAAPLDLDADMRCEWFQTDSPKGLTWRINSQTIALEQQYRTVQVHVQGFAPVVTQDARGQPGFLYFALVTWTLIGRKPGFPPEEGVDWTGAYQNRVETETDG